LCSDISFVKVSKNPSRRFIHFIKTSKNFDSPCTPFASRFICFFADNRFKPISSTFNQVACHVTHFSLFSDLEFCCSQEALEGLCFVIVGFIFLGLKRLSRHLSLGEHPGPFHLLHIWSREFGTAFGADFVEVMCFGGLRA